MVLAAPGQWAQHPAWVLGPSSPRGAVPRQGMVPSLPFWVQMSSELPREFLETQTGCVRAASRPHGVTRPELARLPPGPALLRALPSGHCLLIDAWKQTQRGHVTAAGLGTRCSQNRSGEKTRQGTGGNGLRQRCQRGGGGGQGQPPPQLPPPLLSATPTAAPWVLLGSEAVSAG